MSGEYQIRKGDTLSSIAKQYNISIKKLLDLNPKLKGQPNLIFNGDKINVPSADNDETIPGFTIEITVTSNKKRPTDTREPHTTPQPSKPEASPRTETPAQNGQMTRQQGQELVSIIIKNDKKAHEIDVDRMASKITDAAFQVGIKPDSLAAIVQNESHFSERMISSGNGKGPAGITSIVPKDMYQRPELYDSKLALLIKQHGSLAKVFAAKKANPTLNLGDFGEMLYKYKTPDNLNAALKKDFDLNLKIGAYVYKYNLKQANGNENIAFQNYNTVNKPVKKNGKIVLKKDGTPLKQKEAYANTAMATMRSARKKIGTT